MSTNAANAPDYTFEASQLDAETFEVVRFQGAEEISRLFEFSLDLYSTEVELDFSKVVNQAATFTMMRGDEEVPIHGIVTRFEQVGKHEVTGARPKYHYRTVLSPHLWRLSLNYQSRIFQNQSVEDIIETILKENDAAAGAFRFDLSETYPARAYCVQHQETDLAFVSRLMEHEGICYFFEQGANTETLVMTDKTATAAHPEISTSGAALSYQHVAGEQQSFSEKVQEDGSETIWRFACRERVVTGEVLMKDYNYETPETSLESKSQLGSGMAKTKHYEYGEHFENMTQGDRLAKVRREEIACRRKVMRGKSDCTSLHGGYRFTVADHYRDDRNGDYLLMRVEHEGSQADAVGAGMPRTPGEEGDQPGAFYRNTFTCIPTDVQYRPERRTPKPEVPGVMTARVDGGGGNYAYLDDQGRYRAKMHFDRRSGQADGTTSKPIRMNQPRSGKGSAGFHTHNRPGTEMVFACVNGDPDRPMALGTAPNKTNPSPVTSENNSQSILATEADNEIGMDDKKEKERILVHCPRDNSELVLGGEATIRSGGASTLHGGGGVMISAWPDDWGGETTSAWIDTFRHAVSGLKTAANLVLGGKPRLKPAQLLRLKSVMGLCKDGISLGGKIADRTDGEGQAGPTAKTLEAASNWPATFPGPGIFMSSPGSMDVITGSGVTFMPADGFDVLTPMGVDLTAGESIGLTAGIGGIDLFAQKSRIQAKTATGSIELEALKKNVYITGKKDIKATAHVGNVDVAAEKDCIRLTAGKEVTIEAEKKITLKCGDTSITLDSSGINLDTKGDVTINGKNVTSKAKIKNVIKGQNVLSKAKAKHDTEGGFITSKAKVSNDVKGKALTVKGQLVKVG